MLFEDPKIEEELGVVVVPPNAGTLKMDFVVETLVAVEVSVGVGEADDTAVPPNMGFALLGGSNLEAPKFNPVPNKFLESKVLEPNNDPVEVVLAEPNRFPVVGVFPPNILPVVLVLLPPNIPPVVALVLLMPKMFAVVVTGFVDGVPNIFDTVVSVLAGVVAMPVLLMPKIFVVVDTEFTGVPKIFDTGVSALAVVVLLMSNLFAVVLTGFSEGVDGVPNMEEPVTSAFVGVFPNKFAPPPNIDVVVVALAAGVNVNVLVVPITSVF